MSHGRLLAASARLFRLLLQLYPPEFRDEMGDVLIEAYRDRARDALSRGCRSYGAERGADKGGYSPRAAREHVFGAREDAETAQ